MTSGDRLKALMAVWVALVLLLGVVIVFMSSSSVAWAAVSLGAMLMVVALLATFMITRAKGPTSEPLEREEYRGKAKRSDTALVERLIDSMSDDELAAFRERLMGGMSTMGDDGEIVPLDRPRRRASGAPRDDR